MRKPSWKKAPKWAKYLARDDDGAWGWFSHKPIKNAGRWWTSRGNWDEARQRIQVTQILERRPC